jgi:glycosyltransferase A (GT-A) superfamily protein (DUF2064 family)
MDPEEKEPPTTTSSSPLALAVFARLPVPGQAKTRLAASGAGAAGAARLYARSAELAFARVAAAAAGGGGGGGEEAKRRHRPLLVLRQVHCSREGEAREVEAWLRGRWSCGGGEGGGGKDDGEDDDISSGTPADALVVWQRYGEGGVVAQADTPDLGERMRVALHSAANEAARRAAVRAAAGAEATAAAAAAATPSPPPFTHVRAFIVGSDVPGLTSRIIEGAAQALEEEQEEEEEQDPARQAAAAAVAAKNALPPPAPPPPPRPLDAIFGPAADGGYYLIGVRLPVSWGGVRSAEAAATTATSAPIIPVVAAPPAALFRGIEWSTPTVLRRTLEAARAAGLRVDPPLPPAAAAETMAGAAATAAAAAAAAAEAGPTSSSSSSSSLLPVLRDIDTMDDLRAWLRDEGEGEEEEQDDDEDGGNARALSRARRRLRLVAEAERLVAHAAADAAASGGA